MSETNELKQLKQVADGDEQALASMFTACRERLRPVITFRLDKRLSRRVDADDILQEVFIDAAKRQRHFDPAGSFFVWLRLVAIQTIATIHKRHFGVQNRDIRREVATESPASSTSIAMADRFLDSLTSPSQAAMRQELGEQLRQALSDISSTDQEIIAMRHFEDLSNREIAEALEIEQDAASIRYVRAIRRLKSILDSIPGFGVA